MNEQPVPSITLEQRSPWMTVQLEEGLITFLQIGRELCDPARADETLAALTAFLNEALHKQSQAFLEHPWDNPGPDRDRDTALDFAAEQLSRAAPVAVPVGPRFSGQDLGGEVRATVSGGYLVELNARPEFLRDDAEVCRAVAKATNAALSAERSSVLASLPPDPVTDPRLPTWAELADEVARLRGGFYG